MSGWADLRLRFQGSRRRARVFLLGMAIGVLVPGAATVSGGELRFLAQEHGILRGNQPVLLASAAGRIWTAPPGAGLVSFDGSTWNRGVEPVSAFNDDGRGGLWALYATGGLPWQGSPMDQADARSGLQSSLQLLPGVDAGEGLPLFAYSAVDTAFMGFAGDSLRAYPWLRVDSVAARGATIPARPVETAFAIGPVHWNTLYGLGEGEVWLNTNGGWYRRSVGGWELMAWPGWDRPYVTRAPRVYWGTDTAGLFEWSPASGITARHPSGQDLTIGEVRNVFADPSGHVWAQGSKGFAVRNRSGWLSLPSSAVRPGGSIVSSAIDSSGNIWSYQDVPGEGLVLVRFDGQYVHRLSVPVAPTFQTKSGLLLGAQSDSVTLIRGGFVERLAGGGGLVGPLLEDDAGIAWFKLRAGLLRFAAGAAPESLAGPADTAYGSAVFLPTRRAQELWFRAQDRLFRYRANNWSTFPIPRPTKFMVAHPVAGIYAVPDSGLLRFDFASETWERLDADLGYDLVSRIHMGSNGTLWIVEGETSLLRYDNRGLFPAPGLNLAGIHLFEDRDGRLYLWGEGAAEDDASVFEYDGDDWIPLSLVGSSGFGPWIESGPLFDASENPWLLGTIPGLGRVAVFRREGAWRMVPFEFPEGAGAPVFLDADDQLWFDSGTVMRLDRTPPITTILNQPPARLATSNVSITCTPMLEAGTGIEYQGRVVGEPWDDTWSTTSTRTFSFLPDGRHCVEIRARDRFGNVEPTPRLACFEIDTRPPLGSLAGTPAVVPPGDSLAIVGSAADANFSSYEVRIVPIVCGRRDEARARSYGVRRSSVAADTLAMFGGLDSGGWPDGRYVIELTVVDDLGLQGLTSAEIVLDRAAPFAAETSPAFRTREQGGEVHAEGGAALLALPPLALETDATIEVALGALEDFGIAAPASSPTVGDAVRVAFGESTVLTRPAILSLRVGSTCADPAAGAASTAPSPAVHQAGTDGTWRRLGGTLRADRAWFDVPIERAGVFALFAEDAAPEGEQSALGQTLALTPRVFRAGSTTGASSLIISFSMADAGSVSAFVHDRAGRRVRTLAEGTALGPGIQSLRWDGRDASGEAVTHGLYIVTVQTPAATLTKTCVVEGR